MSIHSTAFAALLVTAIAGSAWAKLPPPTQEEQLKAEQAKQKAAEDAEKAQQSLQKAQDRVVQKYKEGGTRGSSQAANVSSGTEVPSAALQSRPTEKAGAYNEAVTPESAKGALAGDRPQGKVPQ